jgi:hypothetical protein
VTTAECGRIEMSFMRTVVYKTLAVEENKHYTVLGFCCCVDEVFRSPGMLQTANHCHATSQMSKYCKTHVT